jgi:hypothetical protein
MTNYKVALLTLITILVVGCGGGGGGGGTGYIAPSVSSTTYSGSVQTIHYSDGSTAVNNATSSTDSWASDHVTKTTSYSYANGGSNSVVETVSPTISIPVLTTAAYSSNWTSSGSVTPPTVSAKNTVYGDGYTSAIENGTLAKPFTQTTLSALSITDPSKYVTSSTTTYNLTWGTPDKTGPTYAALFPNTSTHLTSNIGYVGRTVSGQGGITGPTLVQPSSDVLAAWNAGWTGSGKNVLTIDSYSSIGTCTTASTCHGITTMMISDLVAPGASKFALDWSLATTAKTISGTTLGTPTNMNAINMSYGTNQAGTTAAINFLTGATSIANLTVTGAVLTKAAGNDYGQDTYSYVAGGDYFVKGLVDNSSTVTRLLIVGALNKNGTTSSPATIASYSNHAGTTAAAQNRFIVANGNAPYANGGVAINGSSIVGYNGGNVGTSYAAPVVAGYAAIVMQKFPNLNAANTSNIILDTARTDTLSCTPNCDPAIYGKGEASLSRALAPVGRLR